MPSDPKDVHDEDKPSFKRSTQKKVLISLVVLVALVLIAGVGMHYTSQPYFCNTCHEISPNVASWQVSPHDNVPCLNCHANPGTVGYVSRKLKGLGEVYLHFTNQIPAKIEPKINIQTCINCHTGQNSGFPAAKNITIETGPQAPRISHKFMLDNKVSCLNCHRYTAHPPSQQTPGVR